MVRNTAKYPLLRKTFATILLLGLVASFFAFNYLVYIPHQQNMYNEKIFRVMHEMADDIITSVNYNNEYLSKNLAHIKTAPEAKKFIPSSNDIVDSVFKKNLDASFDGYEPTKDTEQLNFHFIKDSIVFKGRATRKPKYLGTFISPLEKLHPNIFSHLMLAETDSTRKDRHKILYKTASLAVDETLEEDSVFKQTATFEFASLKDMSIEGNNYKVFFLPFSFGNQHLLLGGFITDSAYKQNAMGYSSSTLTLIGVLVVLVIISLPIVKIFMLGRRENITIMDVRWIIVSLVVAPIFVLSVTSSVWIYHVIDTRTDSMMNNIERSVIKNFTNEVGDIVHQLKKYDTIYKHPDSSKAYNKLVQLVKNKKDSVGTPANDLKDDFFYPDVYKNLDGIFWINRKGWQIAKWYFSKRSGTYLDLSKRDYFKNGIKGAFYKLQGCKDSFLLEPTISWTSGEYTINIIIKSNLTFNTAVGKDTAALLGMSCSMYSVCNTVRPKNINFCIADGEGQILIHSQTFRGLHENIIEESYNNAEVKSAISNKKIKYFNQVKLYDKNVKMNICPLEGTPFFLVTYYDKRDQELAVGHISRFIFFVSSMSVFILLIYLVSYYMSTLKSTELYFNEGESVWMKPTPKRSDVYAQIILCEVVILSLLTLIFLFIPSSDINVYVLQAIFLLPFYITTGYYIIRRKHNDVAHNKANKEALTKLIAAYYLFATLGHIVLFRMLHYNSTHFCGLADWSLLVVSATLPWLVLGIIVFQRKKLLLERFYYRDNYVRSIFLTVIMFSVIPFLGFINYAFHEESTMQTKGRQYYIAQQIDKRRNEINDSLANTKLSFAKETRYIQARKFDALYGIYLPRNGVSTIANDQWKQPVNQDKTDNDHFYELITQFLLLPSDHVDFFENTDSYGWYQDTNKKALLLAYNNETDKQNADAVQIKSGMSYKFALSSMLDSATGWLILLLIISFLAFLYKLIYSLTKKIFLLDYFDENPCAVDVMANAKIKERIKGWQEKHFQLLQLEETDRQMFKGNKQVNSDIIREAEEGCSGTPGDIAQCVLLIQQILAPCYKSIWRSCTDDEKFILYDFATDGFTNYKNGDILFGLYLKGLIIKNNDQVLIMTKSFKNFLIKKTGSSEIMQLKQKLSIGSGWSMVKTFLLILLFIIILFLFITQKEISKELITVVSGLVTLVPLLLKIFDKNTAAPAGKSGR